MLVATAVTLVTLPLLVLYNLISVPQPEVIELAAVSKTEQVDTVASLSSESGRQLGAAVPGAARLVARVVADNVTTTTTTTTTTIPPTTTTTTAAPPPSTTEPESEPAPEPQPDSETTTTSEPIDEESLRPTDEVWQQLAECESTGNWSVNSGNGYYGGLQFSLRTWRDMGGTGFPHDATSEEQIMRANILWERRGFAPWPTCARRLGWS